MYVKLSAVCVSVALSGLACSGGEAPPADKKAAPASAAKSAAPATQAAPEPPKKEWVKVDKFGVQLEVPAGAKFEPGAGTSLMLMTQDGGCTVMLSKKDDMSFFQSYDSTIGDIETWNHSSYLQDASRFRFTDSRASRTEKRPS